MELKEGRRKPGIFYGWIVCAAGLLLIFVTMGTVSNGFSVFMPFIIKQHGLTNAQTSSLVTLRCVVSFISMLLIGKYYEKTGYRIGTVIALLCACATFTIYSFSETYISFAIGAAISGFSYGLGSMIPVSIIMNNWFTKHKALSIGICGMGSGVATVVLPPVITSLIENHSMEYAFRVLAIMIFVIAVIVFIFMRAKPEDKGLKPLGEEDSQQSEKSKEMESTALEAQGESFGPSRKCWIYIGCVCLFMGALANPGFVHLSVLFTSEGFKPMTVAAAISVAGVLIAVGKVICGSVTDRIGGRRSSMLFGTILVIGHLLCCFAFLENVPLCMTTVVLLGLGYPLATIGPSIWAVDMSSKDRYPKTVRRFQVIYAGGALLFASVPGIMADWFGNYISAYILFTALMAAAVVLVILAYRETRKNNEKKVLQ